MKRKLLAGLLQDERGFTLVEVLIAVTIMSIISTTIMGYFITAMEQSAEQNRRIIAANLGRFKISELREYSKKHEKFQDLRSAITDLSKDQQLSLTKDSQSKIFDKSLLQPSVVNGTTYRYKVDFAKDSSLPSAYLARMIVTVSWALSGNLEAKPAKMIKLDSFIVRGKGER